MKPLTASSLQSILDTDLVWRRREITVIVTAIGSSNAAGKVALIRSAVPLLYAHWEGFGKTCFQRYLEHVSYKNLQFKQLGPAFFYLIALGRIQEISKSPAKIGVPLLPEIFGLMDKVNRNPFRKMIDTKNNLRHDVLESLCVMCGLDPSPFSTDQSFIDHEICDPRNEIAHGYATAPSLENFTKRRDRVFAIMTKLQTLVVNGAVNDGFRA